MQDETYAFPEVIAAHFNKQSDECTEDEGPLRRQRKRGTPDRSVLC